MNDNSNVLAVAALQNGTVIDHIPPHLVFKIISLLGIEKLEIADTRDNAKSYCNDTGKLIQPLTALLAFLGLSLKIRNSDSEKLNYDGCRNVR